MHSRVLNEQGGKSNNFGYDTAFPASSMPCPIQYLRDLTQAGIWHVTAVDEWDNLQLIITNALSTPKLQLSIASSKRQKQKKKLT